MSAFDVIYSNPRKKKDASQDGAVHFDGKQIKLMDDNGKQIAMKQIKPEEMAKLSTGDHVSLGGWDVELGEPRSDTPPADAAAPCVAPPPRASMKRLPGGLSRPAMQPRPPSTPTTVEEEPPPKSALVSAEVPPPPKPAARSFVAPALVGSSGVGLHRPRGAALPAFADGGPDELVLNRGDASAFPVKVDRRLASALREHQREGVQFMYDCVMGRRASVDGAPLTGAILAHSMGLGKTLQALSLVHTMLRGGPRNTPILKKALIVCPASLCKNWLAEWGKWFPKGSTVFRPVVLPQLKAEAKTAVRDFVHCPPEKLLIISYEALRTHAEALSAAPIGLMVCDEGHRLKSTAGNKTTDALRLMTGAKRVLLSGTPVQNDLEELWAMCDFAVPGALGDLPHFRATFVAPVRAGRQAGATAEERELADRRNAQLKERTERFMQRRDQSLLQLLLPHRTELVVCCALSPTQSALYHEALHLRRADPTQALQALLAMRGVCSGGSARAASDQDSLALPTEYDDDGAEVASSPLAADDVGHVGKLSALMRLLPAVRAAGEKVVIVAQYQRSLDLLQAALAARGWGALRLDGHVAADKRQELVDRFNAPRATEFAFLLSTRAGGTGFNLCAANRLIMYDPDWNPAADSQAMARVFRDGQTRQVYIWRLLATGTIEEKMYQRQLFKTQVADEVMVAGAHGVQESRFSHDELRELFSYDERSRCDTLALLLQSMPDHALNPAAGRPGWTQAWLEELPDAALRGAIEGDDQLLGGGITCAVDVKLLDELGRNAAAFGQRAQRTSGVRCGAQSDAESASPCPSPSDSEEGEEEGDKEEGEEEGAVVGEEEGEEGEEEGGDPGGARDGEVAADEVGGSASRRARGPAVSNGLQPLAEGANQIAGSPRQSSPRRGKRQAKRHRQLLSDNETDDDDE